MPGKKLLKMASMPSMATAAGPRRMDGSAGDHVTLEVPLQALHSSASGGGLSARLESQDSGREAASSSIAPETPAPAVIPAVAAAMATSYFSELGLDDVPQVMHLRALDCIRGGGGGGGSSLQICLKTCLSFAPFAPFAFHMLQKPRFERCLSSLHTLVRFFT